MKPFSPAKKVPAFDKRPFGFVVKALQNDHGAIIGEVKEDTVDSAEACRKIMFT